MAAAVLYIVDGLGLSGKTKAMVDLIAGLDPDRYRAHVICFDTEQSALYERLKSLGVGVDEIKCPDRLNVGVMTRIGAVAWRLRPQVIHCYNPRPMLYGGTVARVIGVRAVLGTLSAFACLTPDGQYRFLPQRLVSTSRRNRMRNRIAALLVKAIGTVSPSLGQNFCRYNGIDLARLRVVPYGVDVDRFAAVTPEEIAAFRARQQLPAGAIVIGSVGRLVEQKDYPTQLRAFALAARVDPRLRMVLAGDGPLRSAIETHAAELGISDRLVLLGHWVRVPALLKALDVFVLASKFEPYGVALLEAKCAGSAIVATAVNEIPKLLRDGVTGLIVPAEAPEPMAQAFLRMSQDAALRRSLAAAAYAEAENKHSIDAVARAYQALYDTPS